MGMTRHVAKMIMLEHKYKPLEGEILLCGRQTIALTPDEALRVLEEVGLPLRREARIELDTYTRGGAGDTIADRSFFSLFSDAEVRTTDITDYEGADILLDLNEPIPDAHLDRFSFIFSGGCMDNMFDPVTFLRNTCKMLRVGGRLMCFEISGTYPTAYLMYSPDWFFDYFAINNFADCQVYFAQFGSVNLCQGHWNLFRHMPFKLIDGRVVGPGMSSIDVKTYGAIVCLAEKGADSTIHKSPVQCHYRGPEGSRDYLPAAIRFSRSPRPVISTGVYRPLEEINLDFCGSFY